MTILLALVISVLGCSEGLLWRTGKYFPWSQKKWAAEQQLATTLYQRQEQIQQLADQAKRAGPGERDSVANELGQIYLNDPIMLVKIQAIKSLGDLDCPRSHEILRRAMRDSNTDIRMMAIRSLERMPADIGIPALADALNSDTDLDVRLAAIRGLGSFSDMRATEVLRRGLDDRDPAIQLGSMESLQRVTGEKLGRDLRAWKSMFPANELNQVYSADQTSPGSSFR